MTPQAAVAAAAGGCVPGRALFTERVHIVCGEYHAYWRAPGLLRNPRADLNTRCMMDLKQAGHPAHDVAVQHFGVALARRLAGLLEGGARIQVAVVPAHAVGGSSGGLMRIVRDHIRPRYRVCNSANLLRRHTDVAKRATGGARALDSVRQSIEVVPCRLDGATPVILLDDVMSTGHTLEGCCALLEAAGARSVIPFALLRTAQRGRRRGHSGNLKNQTR